MATPIPSWDGRCRFKRSMFMEGFIQFVSDMGTVMNRYGVSLFRGAGMTLLIAITGLSLIHI